jgi:hypothetical protein
MNDFKKWHLSFMVPYVLTLIAGLLRSENAFAYQIHPLLGILTVIVPLVTYLVLPNKKLIRQMIKNNFNYRGKPLMKVAKVTTQIIIVYFVFSAVTGFLLNNGLYGTPAVYQILAAIHGIAKFLVPVVVLTHAGARIALKKR